MKKQANIFILSNHKNWLVVWGLLILLLKSKKVEFFIMLILPSPKISLSLLNGLFSLSSPWSSFISLCISISFLGRYILLYSSMYPSFTSTFWPRTALPSAIRWSGTVLYTLGRAAFFISFLVFPMLKIWLNSSSSFSKCSSCCFFISRTCWSNIYASLSLSDSGIEGPIMFTEGT